MVLLWGQRATLYRAIRSCADFVSVTTEPSVGFRGQSRGYAGVRGLGLGMPLVLLWAELVVVLTTLMVRLAAQAAVSTPFNTDAQNFN